MKGGGGAQDKWWQIVLQVFPTYLMAGCGMVGAGLLLDHVPWLLSNQNRTS